jgi:hypothetical protein
MTMTCRERLDAALNHRPPDDTDPPLVLDCGVNNLLNTGHQRGEGGYNHPAWCLSPSATLSAVCSLLPTINP